NDGGNPQRDRVAGPAVDLDQLPVLPDEDLGEEGVVLQVVDLDAFDLPAKLVDDAGQQIVRLRPRGGNALQAAVDGIGFVVPDHDGELPLAIHLLEVDDLLVLHLTNDDFMQFHLDGHSCGSRVKSLAY